MVLLGAAAFAGGSYFPTILAMTLWAYTMYGAGVTPALLAALVWPRVTRQAGVASIAVGMGTTVIWETAALLDGSYPLGVQTIYPALAASIATLVAGSVRRRGPAQGLPSVDGRSPLPR